MRLLLATCLLASLVGCSSGSGTQEDTSPLPSPALSELATGRTPLPLAAGTLLSPEGFVPPLQLALPARWSSTRRGDDGFDLMRPGVTVLLLTPNGDTVAPALAAAKAAARGGSVTDAAGTLAGLPARGFEVVGGSGRLLASPVGTVALDARPGQHVRVLGADVDEVPLVAAVVVPDGARWAQLLPQAEELLRGITTG